MKREKIINVILVIFLIIFTATIVKKSFQNDTFFTIAIGEEIIKNGIDENEKMVWHEGLKFTNPRWLFDIVITLIYNHFDFVGIYVFVIIIACLEMLFYYYIINKISKNKILSFLYTIFITYLVKGEFCARGQLISFLVFLIEFYSIEQLLETNRKRYYIILGIIPFILVSFHSSVYPVYFLIFVPYIIEFILSKINIFEFENTKFIVEKHKISRIIIFLIIGIIAIFITPKGTEPILYIFKNLSGLSSEFISELQPLLVENVPIGTTMFIISLVILGFTKTKVKITDCFFILGFYLLSLNVIRVIFFYYLISSICIIRIIVDFMNDYNIEFKIKNKKLRNCTAIVIVALLLSYMSLNFSSNYMSDYVDEKDYPVKATEFIKENIDISKMKIYNHFNFGSYLEFNGIKTFLDSRSEVFTKEFNKDCTILEDWYNITEGDIDYKEIFEKYGVTHALLYKTELISLYIDDDSNWNKIYEDEQFVLYEKVN